MEDQTTRRDELDARFRGIESELKSLRGVIEQQSSIAAKMEAALAGLEAKLTPLNRELAKTRSKRRSGVRGQLRKAFAAAYVRCARLLLRADVEDLFDRGYYLTLHPDLTEEGVDPIYHYLWVRRANSPHWLFDRVYYLEKYPDVAAAKVDPLVHFLRSGWREGRNPHPLFNTNFYLEQVPELRSSKSNPIAHYLETGWRNGLQPHPLFDGNFYLANHRDVVRAGMDPLSHYLLFGALEGRQAHPWFDTDYYRTRYPDVIQARVEPIQHYMNHGAGEGRNPHPIFDTLFYQEEYGSMLAGMSPLEHFVRIGQKMNCRVARTDCIELFLPVTPYIPPPPRNRIVDIVIPVYRGLAETRACIESVQTSRNREPFELIVIDDLSPEPALSAWLSEASAGGSFTLLRNEANLGFVETVNRGMSLHPDRDVILLNSDTTVANDWVDRLVRCAYRSDLPAERVGTVTPFSNNATICSYPRFCEENPLPVGASAEQLDILAAEVNQGRSIDVPTAVGFCMYIRRECLRDTGMFDVEAFKKGYGEENDFSLRAAALGWRNVLAADVFVYHAGSVSFSKGAGLLRAQGIRTVQERYPQYLPLVSRHVTRDAAQPYRFALTAARFRNSPNPTILLVTHDLAGGTKQHIEELVEALRGECHFLVLTPDGGTHVLLRSADSADGISLRLDTIRQYDILLSLLRTCNVSRMHVHHVLRHSLSLEKLRDDLNVPLEFTVHDYFAVCPRIVLAGPDGRYCGEPDEAGCNECIRDTMPHLTLDIASWRAKYSWLVNSADLVIAPSQDTAVRMSRYFPPARLKAAAHPNQPAPGELSVVRPRRIEGDGVLRIAVLGVMSINKGFRNLERCEQIVRERGLPLEFVLIGYCEPQLHDQGPFTFRQTGEYTRPELPAILAGVDPHLMWFPVRWPETFSYTLSFCFEQGLPVAGPQLGALPERLGRRRWTWIYHWDTGPEALTALFLRIRDAMISGEAPRPAPVLPQADLHFYPDRYRSAAIRQAPFPAVDLRESGRLSVIALLSCYDSNQIQSCGYIRTYLPLMHDKLRGMIQLAVATPSSALAMKADILLVQRTAVPTLALAEKLVHHCESQGMRIIYETDDDLFNIHPSHAESSFYKALIAPAEFIAHHAAMVLVSSTLLKERLAHLNSDIRVIPNALDESIWFRASYKNAEKPIRRATSTVRILYMGSMTHSKDLQILEEPMRLLKAEFGSRIELDIVGISRPDGSQCDWFNAIEVPGICGHSYPLFVEWIRKNNHWDFGVAPLVDDEFNRCKSFIKYLDFGALGLPGIFSAIGVFEEVVRQGETGLCVHDTASWYEAIRLLITDQRLRETMGQAAYRDVLENHTLGGQAASHREFWNQLSKRPAVRSSSTMISFSVDTAATSSKGI